MLKECILYNLIKDNKKTDLYIMDFYTMDWNLYLVWNLIKMDLFIMDNGKIMLEMVGEYFKINQLVIDMQASGNKIERQAMEDKLL